MKMLSTIFAAALALVLQGNFAGAHATSNSAHCTGMTVTDAISSDVLIGTGSTSWVNVTDGKMNIITSATGCVIVTFSATGQVYPVNPSHEALHVRMLLDNKAVCTLPYLGDVLLSSADSEFESTNSITRICEHVPAGTHSVQIQYHSGGGADVDMFGHVLTVTHN